ncbi:glycosyl hydrolase, putative [Talaromyces stipitatus ATCC 10500]|uniref:Glycosyl hydrolase, putative n=1 Tax=Talaromyces stipitatus (strain ATCC 10500 / CBS 375.48 / QM 6759 / NRRL 1006) TaxID=441959 RepID=B8M378_TALSN|nr:glycosyl hydrolase, putative [Talaromyces stipitatus ATCC 10500]EED22054.1 glycosyl hydrolase, putative [Talaromyces stipitatus ATCC 10500]
MSAPPYKAIEDYGIIGDMHTAALVSKDGSMDFLCWPVFDSPSVFCRLLDKDKGGHFSIHANVAHDGIPLSKQRYLPYTNILETRWIHEIGVLSLIDFFPVSNHKSPQSDRHLSGYCACTEPGGNRWKSGAKHSGIIRRLECSRGTMGVTVEVFPAFNYAQDGHTTRLSPKADEPGNKLQCVYFESPQERLQLDIWIDNKKEGQGPPKAIYRLENRPGHLGQGLVVDVEISEGQSMIFVLHSPEKTLPGPTQLASYLSRLESETFHFWTDWSHKCTFRGHYRETVERSLLILKLLTYKPTGAVIAAPTFSLPENIGGTRNWDYRYSWVRDTSFTLYAFLKNGYDEEAEAYITFIFDRVFPPLTQKQYTKEQHRPFLPIMFTIRGDSEIPEFELNHMDGYRGSKPVRIGNAAAFHTQLDIYGELMDSIYMYNSHAKPIQYDQWLGIRRMVNYVIQVRDEPDMSIWEVRGKPQHFLYSKMLLWVALDRGVRLADKHSTLPCPDKQQWIRVRDDLYDEIMDKGFNEEKGFFCQSYENTEVVDAALMIAPLVLFVEPNDRRFLSTLDKVLEPPEKSGLTSASMVFRYDHEKAQDGVGGREGAFIMITFWAIEAMFRVRYSPLFFPTPHSTPISDLEKKASKYTDTLPNGDDIRRKAIASFDNCLSFANHLGIFSEEVAISGEAMGNVPQAFSHLSCISAAMNLPDIRR